MEEQEQPHQGKGTVAGVTGIEGKGGGEVFLETALLRDTRGPLLTLGAGIL